MKCSNCGKKLEGSLCLNCGTINDFDYSSESSISNEDNKNLLGKKGMSKKALIIILSLIALLAVGISVVFILNKPKVITFVDKTSSVSLLENDFKNKIITVNQYALYNTYFVYDYNKLPKKYQKNIKDFAPDITNIYSKYFEELDDSTKKYMESKIYLTNLRFGTAEDTQGVGYVPLADKVSADEEENITTLDKAVASNNVVVWYTDNKDSADKTTDEIAKKISQDIDTVINDLSAAYGVEYKFNKQYSLSSDKYEQRAKILDKYNISRDYMDKLNIYIFNFNSESSAGKYSYILCSKGGCDETAAYDKSYIVAPYLALNSTQLENSNDIRYIYTHELYHQLQHNLISDGKFNSDMLESDKYNNEFFTSETTANYAAVKLNPNASFDINNRIGSSIEDIEQSIEDTDGYQSFRFLNDYEKIVGENSIQVIRDSIKYPNRIKYLEEQAGDKYDDVIARYGYNTLTNKYSIEKLKYTNIIRIDGKEEKTNDSIVPVREICTTNCKEINASSVNYYKIKVKDNLGKNIKVKAKDNEKLNVQFVSANEKQSNFTVSGKYLYEYNFINQSNVTSLTTTDFIKTSVDSYKNSDVIFIVISNGDIDNVGNYEISIDTEGNGTDVNVGDVPKTDDPISDSSDPLVPTVIYLGENKLEVESFQYNWRTYVNLEEFCKKAGCNVSNKDSKTKIITRDITIDTENKAQYAIEMAIGDSNYDSKLVINNNQNDYFNLTQRDIIDKSCPNGKDRDLKLPEKSCDDKNTYVPIRFIMQGLGYIVDYKQEKAENKVLLYDIVNVDFKDKGYNFVLSGEETSIGDQIKNPIQIKDGSVTIKKDSKTYYVYVMDSAGNRQFKSSFSFKTPINGTDPKIGKYFEKNKENNSFGLIAKGNTTENEDIFVTTNYTPMFSKSEYEFRTEGVSYPIVYKINVKIE